MKTTEIKKNKEDYKKVARTLMEIRPYAHVISAATTISCVLLMFVSWQYFDVIYETIGVWTYIISASIAIPLAIMYEKKLEGIIDSLGIVIAGGESKRLIFVMLVISFPLIFLAASSSFLGVSEMTSQRGDLMIQSEIASIELNLNANTNQDKNNKSTRESLVREQRNVLRASIENKYKAKLKKVPISNLAKFDKSTEWYKKELNNKNASDSASIELKMLEKIEQFDIETEKILTQLATSHTALETIQGKSTNELIKTKTERTKAKVNRLDWVGNFFGWIAVLALAISVLSSIAARYICKLLNIHIEDLSSKKGKRIAPTLFKNNTSKDQKSNINSSFGGVGESKSIESLKKRAIFVNEERFSNDHQTSQQAIIELMDLIDELEQHGIDIVYKDNEEKEISFRKI